MTKVGFSSSLFIVHIIVYFIYTIYFFQGIQRRILVTILHDNYPEIRWKGIEGIWMGMFAQFNVFLIHVDVFQLTCKMMLFVPIPSLISSRARHFGVMLYESMVMLHHYYITGINISYNIYYSYPQNSLHASILRFLFLTLAPFQVIFCHCHSATQTARIKLRHMQTTNGFKSPQASSIFRIQLSPFHFSNLKFPGTHLCITPNTWTGN